jgi:flagellar hook-length control protein FliK
MSEASADSAASLTTGQEGAIAQASPLHQSNMLIAVGQAEPILTAGNPAAVEKPQKQGKSEQELGTKEDLPGTEVRPDQLTSRSMFQPGAETAGKDTTERDPSDANQQEAKPDGAEIVHSFKSAVILHKEVPKAQPQVHAEIQHPKENSAQSPVELASLPESQDSADKASREAAFATPTASETAPPVVSPPEPAAPLGLAGAAVKATGTPQANVNWSHVEKAQVVSQIVERAHLLGKSQSELLVVLKPEFLGRVNLHAAIVDNQLVAKIIAESASVKQMLESQLSSLQATLHEHGLPVAKVEVVQGSQLSFADPGADQGSPRQHFESAKSQLVPSLPRCETGDENPEVVPLETHIHSQATWRSLNLVA